MSWKVKFLGDVCEIINGSTPLRSNKDFWENGQFPWFTIDDIRQQGRIINHTKQKVTEKALSKLRILPKDSVLLCCTASVGEYAITNIEITTNQQFNGLVVKNKKELNPIYLMHYCSILKDKLLNLSGKTTIDFIAISKLKNLEIPLPPLSEQQAIVEKLDAAFALIDQAKANIEKNIQNAKELFQSKLNQIFSQKGEGWEERKLGEIGKVCMCKRIMKHQTDPDGEIPFYKIGTFGKAADAFISNEIYLDFKKKYSYPKKGEILISASGTIGRRVIFDGEAAYFQDSNIVWIQNDESKVLNNYLYHFYSVCDWNPSKGATISRLYNDDLRKISISFPTIDKQNEQIPIIERLSQQTNLLQEKYRQKLQNLEELRKSILEKAFKGELVQMSESQISTD